MAALTDNKYDVYKWIQKVIDSCKTFHHFQKVHRLIDNFYNRYKDMEMSGRLRDHAHHREFK
jgi:hypothetical protein